jgi:hypothetical protein
MNKSPMDMQSITDMLTKLKTVGLGITPDSKMPDKPLWWFSLAYAEPKALNVDELINIAKGCLFSYALSHKGQVINSSYSYQFEGTTEKLIADLAGIDVRLVYHKTKALGTDSEKLFFIAEDGALFLTHFSTFEPQSWVNVAVLNQSLLDKIKPILSFKNSK